MFHTSKLKSQNTDLLFSNKNEPSTVRGTIIFVYPCIAFRGVRKTKILFVLGYKKNIQTESERPKFGIRADGFPTEIVHPQFRLKVTKITLLAFNVQIKNVLKQDRNRV